MLQQTREGFGMQQASSLSSNHNSTSTRAASLTAAGGSSSSSTTTTSSSPLSSPTVGAFTAAGVDPYSTVSASPASLRPQKPQLSTHSTLADSLRALRDNSSLSQRASTGDLRAIAAGGSSSRRKAAPSPLQHFSFTPYSSTNSASRDSLRTVSTPISPVSPLYSPSPSLDSPLSPKQLPHAADAAEHAPHLSRLGPGQERERSTSDSLATPAGHLEAHGQSTRKVSAPAITITAGPSPPTTPTAMSIIAPTQPFRHEPRPAAQRTASHDSAVSSMSSTDLYTARSTPSSQHRPSQETSVSSGQSQQQQQPQQDLASFVAASGSVEAALHSLWKDKQSASAHNTQLWRLVEKQRAMILGLNKDLERALKDKERYRKKLKENLAQQPPLPNGVKRADSALDRAHSQSPAPSETYERESALSDGSLKPLGRADSDLQSINESPTEISPKTVSQNPSNPSSKDVGNATPAASSSSASAARKPINSNKEQRNQAQTNVTAFPGQLMPDQSQAGVQNVPAPRSGAQKVPSTPDLHPAPLSIKPHGSLNAPTVSLTQATPVIGAGAFGAPPSAPPTSAAPRPPTSSSATNAMQPSASSIPSGRKAPPAPLNLAQPGTPSGHLHQRHTGEHDNSDYEDIFDVTPNRTGLPPITQERGRRKTREEDDAMREAQFSPKGDGEASQGKKKSKSKSKTTESAASTPTSATMAPAQLGLPIHDAHPRTASSQMTVPGLGFVGLPASPRLPQGPGSINALLSPTNSESSGSGRGRGSTGSLAGSSPLPSPGLPASPRPGSLSVQAPMGLPMSPRASKASFSTPPLSPRPGAVGTGVGATVLSPRAPTKAIPMPSTDPLAAGNAHLQRAEAHAQREGSVSRHAPPAAQAQQNGRLSDDVPSEVFKGFMDEHYPGLLLPPNALPSVDVKVFSSRMRPSRHSVLFSKPEEDPVFQLGIYAHSTGAQLWRVEKTTSALAQLHQLLMHNVSGGFGAQLPDKSLFSGHAPAKIDARRAALNGYFCLLLDTELSERMAVEVCRFLSESVIEPEKEGGQAGTLQVPAQSSGQVQQARPQQQAAATQAAGVAASQKSRVRKEGYLTKRGKNFGGWKARYFILDGIALTYYDSPGGNEIGRIKLAQAQIGKQQSTSPTTTKSAHSRSPSAGDSAPEDNEYRHAFLVLEPKRKDEKSLVRHVLCAESDDERDAWVEALLLYVEPRDANAKAKDAAQQQQQASQQPRGSESRASGRNALEGQRTEMNLNIRVDGSAGRPRSRGKDSKHSSPDTEKTDAFQSISYDDTVAQQAPVRGPSRQGLPSPPLNGGFPAPQPLAPQPLVIQHAPPQPPPQVPPPLAPQALLPAPLQVGPQVLPQLQALPQLQPQQAQQQQQQPAGPIYGAAYPVISGPTGGMRIEDASMWGNKAPAVKDRKRSIFGFRGRAGSDLASGEKAGAASPAPIQPTGQIVFGVPLGEAVESSQPVGLDVPLPSVVFRSLEYLRVRGAVNEEGIFRLSGSNTTIKGLKDRFNTERDVRLLEGEYYDVHAVASLLKLYLRELPASVLTRELHLDFLKVLDLDEKRAKITAFNLLVHRLPPANVALLRSLSSFLIEIVEASGTNKMNVRNVGIVFAPTLNIPAPLISFFLTDFNDIFGDEVKEEQASPVRDQLAESHRQQAGTGGEWDAVRSPRHQMFSDLPTPAYNQSGFQSMGGFAPVQQAQQQQQQRYPTNGTGYGQPLQEQYLQQQQQAQAYQQAQDPSYGSLNGQPGAQAQQGMSARDAKKARRESSVQTLGYGMAGVPQGIGGSLSEVMSQQRKGSYQSLRQDERDGSRGRGSPARGSPARGY